MKTHRAAFTLIEVIMAISACALILVALYSVFGNAISLRNKATLRTREAAVVSRTATVIRHDLRNAIFSGGILAATLQGSAQAPSSSFPGYLKFTTTTATDAGEDPLGDIQQVEYYIVTDATSSAGKAGLLVRAVDRELLAPTRGETREQPLLPDVASMEVSFFDGESWQPSWENTEEAAILPEAVRVRIFRAAAEKEQVPPPIEILAPWTTASMIEPPPVAP